MSGPGGCDHFRRIAVASKVIKPMASMSAHKGQAVLVFKDTVQRLNQLRLWKDEYMQVHFWPFSFTEALLGVRHGAGGAREAQRKVIQNSPRREGRAFPLPCLRAAFALPHHLPYHALLECWFLSLNVFLARFYSVSSDWQGRASGSLPACCLNRRCVPERPFLYPAYPRAHWSHVLLNIGYGHIGCFVSLSAKSL